MHSSVLCDRRWFVQFCKGGLGVARTAMIPRKVYNGRLQCREAMRCRASSSTPGSATIWEGPGRVPCWGLHWDREYIGGKELSRSIFELVVFGIENSDWRFKTFSFFTTVLRNFASCSATRCYRCWVCRMRSAAVELLTL